jgi:arginyl-tRNA synthetase
MYALEKIKQEIVHEINKIIKPNESVLSVVDFVLPPDKNLGDLSLPCFNLGKKLQKSPNEVASDIAKKLEHKFIKSSVATGPYLNISLSQEALTDILNNLQKNKTSFGFNKSGNNERIMIEFSNANTHKEYHVGHLRNLAYGDAISRILAANGYKVLPVSYINDFGIHVAKTLWWLSRDKGISDLGKAYNQASLALADNALGNKEVGEIMKQVESRRGEMYKLWKKTRQISIKQFAQIYQELNIKFSTIFYENKFIKEGLKMVKELRQKNILIKSDGAIIADLSKYNLGVLVVLRSDGTALYPVADLALAINKIKQYKLAQSLYVVDIRQSLYFDQLFKLLELLGYETNFEHLSYEFVKLPSGMMSSRTGNIIPYEDLKNLALIKTKQEVTSRHQNWSKEKINHVAAVVAFGALKFEMIKVSSLKQITFDIATALKFEGFTAAYLQYTYARINSINSKAEIKIKKAKIDFNRLTDNKERALILELASFPEIIKIAGTKRDPAEIAKYLFDLGQVTNDYYHAIPVLKSEPILASARLALLNSVALVIKQGLNLLGIEVIDEM